MGELALPHVSHVVAWHPCPLPPVAKGSPPGPGVMSAVHLGSYSTQQNGFAPYLSSTGELALDVGVVGNSDLGA